MCWQKVKDFFFGKYLKLLRKTSGGRHAWYKRFDGLVVRKPIQ